jgi:hypothetical protein
METTTQVLTKAYRNTVSIDPILYLPSTRTDHSRLLIWRMGWLLLAIPTHTALLYRMQTFTLMVSSWSTVIWY